MSRRGLARAAFDQLAAFGHDATLALTVWPPASLVACILPSASRQLSPAISGMVRDHRADEPISVLAESAGHSVSDADTLAIKVS